MASKKSKPHISQFAQRVYRQLRRIPAGRVTTYGDLAKRLGKPRGAQAIGQALKRNHSIPFIPCHRVVSANGSIGGYARGPMHKIRLLKQENIYVEKGKIDLEKYKFH